MDTSVSFAWLGSKKFGFNNAQGGLGEGQHMKSNNFYFDDIALPRLN